MCEAEEDLFFTRQPQELYAHLTCDKTLLRFANADHAGAHCRAGAQRLAFGRVFDWLDEKLEADATRPAQLAPGPRTSSSVRAEELATSPGSM